MHMVAACITVLFPIFQSELCLPSSRTTLSTTSTRWCWRWARASCRAEPPTSHPRFDAARKGDDVNFTNQPMHQKARPFHY